VQFQTLCCLGYCCRKVIAEFTQPTRCKEATYCTLTGFRAAYIKETLQSLKYGIVSNKQHTHKLGKRKNLFRSFNFVVGIFEVTSENRFFNHIQRKLSKVCWNIPKRVDRNLGI